MTVEFNHPTLRNEDIIYEYTIEACDNLAMALVERGYNPGVFATIDEDGNLMGKGFTHAFIVIDDPRDAGAELYVDINGIHTRLELFEAWDDIAYDNAMDDGGYDFDIFTGIKAMPMMSKTIVDDDDRYIAELIHKEITTFTESV